MAPQSGGATEARTFTQSRRSSCRSEAQPHWNLPYLSVHAVLLFALRRPKLRRERLDGVSVYLSSDRKLGAAQWQVRRERQERHVAAAAADTLQPSVIIEVLVRHSGSTSAQVAHRLRDYLPPIRRPEVKAVFVRYELEQVVNIGSLAGCRSCCMH